MWRWDVFGSAERPCLMYATVYTIVWGQLSLEWCLRGTCTGHDDDSGREDVLLTLVFWSLSVSTINIILYVLSTSSIQAFNLCPAISSCASLSRKLAHVSFEHSTPKTTLTCRISSSEPQFPDATNYAHPDIPTKAGNPTIPNSLRPISMRPPFQATLPKPVLTPDTSAN